MAAIPPNSAIEFNCDRTTEAHIAHHIHASSYLVWKSAMDRLVAAILLILCLPLIGLLIAFIKLTSKGPAIYSQARVGRGGRIFTMYKLRSMRLDAESTTGPMWASIGTDPRVTPLGYWLRRLHLDELPQLFNVLLGDMSLVGPRPERPEFVRVLRDTIPDYSERLRIKPGITGLAQVNLPPDTDLNSVRRKLVLDRQYLDAASLGLDIRLVLCTALRMFGLRGGKAVSLLGLTRRVHLDAMLSDENDCEGTPTSLHAIMDAGKRNEPRAVRNGNRKRRRHSGDSRIMKSH